VRHRRLAPSVSNRTSRPVPDGLSQLTPREREVLAWLVRGGTNRQIALALNVSPRTVEKHVERILTKFGAANRTIAALHAVETKPKPTRT
jgi:DNA-binding NarL/FixJ family response regulator